MEKSTTTRPEKKTMEIMASSEVRGDSLRAKQQVLDV